MIRYLCGVRGAGKTSLVPELLEASTGFVVLDMDEVLVDGCVMDVPIAFDEARGAWPAYNRHWALLASLVARSAPVLLLGPLVPAEWHAAGGDPATPFALLDIDDAERARRLHARGWSAEEVEDAQRDADDARVAITRHVTSLDDVLAWLGEA